MRLITISLYFAIAIVIFGAIGIALPYCFELMKDGAYSTENLNQNIITYFIAILASSSLDFVLNLIDQDNTRKKIYILIITLANILIIGGAIVIIYLNMHGCSIVIFKWTLLGVALSYIMWWIANYKNPNFNAAAGALGNDPNNALQNG